jgi:O-antigen/teichoic acid export membrane protein
MRREHLVRIDALFGAGVTYLRNKFLHGRIFRAASMSLVAQILSQAIRLCSNLIMTRLLAPEMFGLMSVVLAIQVTLGLLSDFGLRPAIIQSRRGDDPVFLNTVWTIQVLRGIGTLVVCIIIAAALYIAAVLGWFKPDSALASPQLPPVLVVAALAGVIGSFQSSNYVSASRNLNLRAVIIIDLISQVAGLLLMIAVGYLTGSIWSIIAGSLLTVVVSTAMSHINLPGISNRLLLDREAIAEIFKFGVWILLSSTLFVVAANLDRAYLAVAISATLLGVYAIALNLYQAIDGLISRLFDAVVLPALSEAARTSPERLREQVRRLKLPFDIWYLGTAGLLYILAPGIIQVLYDDRYHEAGTLLQILSFGLISVRFNIFNTAYVAIGKPEYWAAINAVKLVSIAILLPLLFNAYGLEGAIYAVALHPLATLPLNYWLMSKVGLLDIKYDLLVLPAWPAGYVVGLAMIELIRLVAG